MHAAADLQLLSVQRGHVELALGEGQPGGGNLRGEVAQLGLADHAWLRQAAGELHARIGAAPHVGQFVAEQLDEGEIAQVQFHLAAQCLLRAGDAELTVDAAAMVQRRVQVDLLALRRKLGVELQVVVAQQRCARIVGVADRAVRRAERCMAAECAGGAAVNLAAAVEVALGAQRQVGLAGGVQQQRQRQRLQAVAGVEVARLVAARAGAQQRVARGEAQLGELHRAIVVAELGGMLQAPRRQALRLEVQRGQCAAPA